MQLKVSKAKCCHIKPISVSEVRVLTDSAYHHRWLINKTPVLLQPSTNGERYHQSAPGHTLQLSLSVTHEPPEHSHPRQC